MGAVSVDLRNGYAGNVTTLQLLCRFSNEDAANARLVSGLIPKANAPWRSRDALLFAWTYKPREKMAMPSIALGPFPASAP